jgi:hypothetical protein
LSYCYFDAVGYASDVLVSPSGNYIGLRRSPEFINSDFAPDASTIIGLTILDISSPNNIGVVRCPVRMSATPSQCSTRAFSQTSTITERD